MECMSIYKKNGLKFNPKKTKAFEEINTKIDKWFYLAEHQTDELLES